MHVTFDETLTNIETSLEDDDMRKNFQKTSTNNPSVQECPSSPHLGDDPPLKDGPPPELLKEWRYAKSHPPEGILGIPSHGVRTRSSFQNIYNFHAFLSQIEPKSFLEAEFDESLMIAIQFERNDV